MINRFRAMWRRMPPLARFYLTFASFITGFVLLTQSWPVVGTIVELVSLVCVPFIRCAWCGERVTARYAYFGRTRVTFAAFPFDTDCTNCGRSLWSIPQEF